MLEELVFLCLLRVRSSWILDFWSSRCSPSAKKSFSNSTPLTPPPCSRQLSQPSRARSCAGRSRKSTSAVPLVQKVSTSSPLLSVLLRVFWITPSPEGLSLSRWPRRTSKWARPALTLCRKGSRSCHPEHSSPIRCSRSTAKPPISTIKTPSSSPASATISSRWRILNPRVTLTCQLSTLRESPWIYGLGNLAGRTQYGRS